MKSTNCIGVIDRIEEITFNSSSERVACLNGDVFVWEERMLKEQKLLPIIDQGDCIVKETGKSFLIIIKKRFYLQDRSFTAL